MHTSLSYRRERRKRKWINGQLNEIVVVLTQKNEYGISFRVADRYLEMARQYETLNILVTYWLMIGGLTGLLVGTGLLGTLFLFQYRRQGKYGNQLFLREH